ncbi:MAG: LysR family transcriptional regulator [Polyangiaceae bacterium]
MGGRNIDFDWNQLKAFVATAETGSFSAAAKRLKVAQPTVGRQVAELESRLGLKLLERRGRGVALTEAGLELVEHARTMMDSAHRISRVAAGQSNTVNGLVSVTATELVATYFLTEVVAELRRDYPDLVVEIVASNSPQDLKRREADIALRTFRPSEPMLVARKIREDTAYLYVARETRKKWGTNDIAAILNETAFVGFDSAGVFRNGLNRAMGLELSEKNFPIVSQSSHVQWAMVRAGLVVGIMLDEIGDHDPTVCRASETLPGIPITTWLVTHEEVRTSLRVRVVSEVIARRLKKTLDPEKE